MRTLIVTGIQVVLFTLLALWFLNNPGVIEIVWLGYKVRLSVALFVTLLTVATLAFYLLVRLVYNVLHIPGYFKARYEKFNALRGLHAVEDSLTALLAKDGPGLKRSSQFVGQFLKDSPLNWYFRAEAALAQQQFSKAQALFQQVSQDPAMSFLGYAGLMRLELATNNPQEALNFGLQALQAKPEAQEMRAQVAELCVWQHHYGQARQHLALLMKQNPTAEVKQHYADVLLKIAQEEVEVGALKPAFANAKRAHELHPSLAALMLLLNVYQQEDKGRQAIALIEASFAAFPEKELVTVYLELKKATAPADQFRAVQRLVSFAPDALESHILTAQYALKARYWGMAHDMLDPLIEQGDRTETIMQLRAELEQAETQKE
jgi:uncharacterized membrane-anchored protein